MKYRLLFLISFSFLKINAQGEPKFTIKGAKKALKSYLKTELNQSKIKTFTKHAEDNTEENLESLSVSEKKMDSYIKALDILKDSEMRLDKLILGISK